MRARLHTKFFEAHRLNRYSNGFSRIRNSGEAKLKLKMLNLTESVKLLTMKMRVIDRIFVRICYLVTKRVVIIVRHM